ncbi:MAG: hypothetical protein IIC69_03565 [Nanoarchaeota archaeon]|nr:hypothetical protein [Nanoarchaeota archaeon]
MSFKKAIERIREYIDGDLWNDAEVGIDPDYINAFEKVLDIVKEEAEQEKKREQEKKIPDKDLVRVHFTGWRNGKWIGGTAQYFNIEVYENFLEKLSEEEKLTVYKMCFYIDHRVGKYPNALGAEIDEYKIVNVNKGGPFIGFRMD